MAPESAAPPREWPVQGVPFRHLSPVKSNVVLVGTTLRTVSMNACIFGF